LEKARPNTRKKLSVWTEAWPDANDGAAAASNVELNKATVPAGDYWLPLYQSGGSGASGSFIGAAGTSAQRRRRRALSAASMLSRLDQFGLDHSRRRDRCEPIRQAVRFAECR
jgi:hypothetical protein